MGRSMSSREFNQDSSGAKKTANHSPVFITDPGETSHVLMSISEYERLVRELPSIVDMLAINPLNGEDICLEPSKIEGLVKPAKFD